MNPKPLAAPTVACRYQSSSLKTVNKNSGLLSKAAVVKPRKQMELEELVPVEVEGVTLDSENLAFLKEPPSSPVNSLQQMLDDLKTHQYKYLFDEIETLKSQNYDLTSTVEHLRNLSKSLIEESATLKSEKASGKLGDLRVELAAVKSKLKIAEAQRGDMKQLDGAKILKLEGDKLIADRERLVLEQTVIRLRQELDELRSVYTVMQREYDLIKINHVKVKRAAVVQLANDMLKNKSEEPTIRKMALAICREKGKDSLQKEVRDQFYAELSDAFKKRTLKEFIATHPVLMPEIEAQLLTVMRGDLLLKANLQAQIKRELKDEAIKTKCDEMLATERLFAEAARKLDEEARQKANLKQNNYLNDRMAEVERLRRENTRLDEEVSQWKRGNRKRERSRSRSRDSRRR